MLTVAVFGAQSITALAHLRAAVLYIVDISEQCGFTIAQQVPPCRILAHNSRGASAFTCICVCMYCICICICMISPRLSLSVKRYSMFKCQEVYFGAGRSACTRALLQGAGHAKA